MDYSQQNSVFRPGLTMRGPVYNSMGALPTVSPGLKTAIMAALILAGVTKKIPLSVAAVGSFAIWKFISDGTTAAPITANLNPADLNAPPPPFDASQLQMPTVGIPS